MHSTELIELSDGSLAIPLPVELLDRLCWRVGDEVTMSEVAKGILLSTATDETTRQLLLGRAIMRDRAGVLRMLAQTDISESKD